MSITTPSFSTVTGLFDRSSSSTEETCSLCISSFQSSVHAKVIGEEEAPQVLENYSLRNYAPSDKWAPIYVKEEEGTHLVLIKIEEVARILKVPKEEIFRSCIEGNFAALAASKTINFRINRIKEVATAIQSTLKPAELKKIKSFLSENYKRLVEEAISREDGSVYVRASEEHNIPRALEIFADGNLIVHLNKNRLGDYRRPAGSSKYKIRCALNADLKNMLLVAVSLAEDEEQKQESIREFEIVKSLENSRGIARVYSLKFVDGKGRKKSFLEQPFYHYGSLADQLKREVFSEREQLQITLDLFYALKKLREEGIIHRDIKPANIFLGKRDGRHTCAYLGDFGIYCRIDETERMTGAGVIPYYSPEYAIDCTQRMRDPSRIIRATYESQMWAFGCCLFKIKWGGRDLLGFEQGL